MKKTISILLSVIMVLTCFTAFADTSTSDAMEKALIAVKTKVEVPAELSEFSTYTNQNNGKTHYSFSWSKEDGSANMEISCDGEGRVTSYYFYDNTLRSEKKLTTLSKEDIISFADSFIKKSAPEAFSDENDCFVYDDESWYVNNLTYIISYKRYKNGIEVNNNNAEVRVNVCNDVPYVRNMNINFDYDTQFEEHNSEIENYKEKYKEAFPIELIYRDKYRYSWIETEDKKDTSLVYRVLNNDAGYISAETGEVVTEDDLYNLYAGSGGVMEESATSDTAANKFMLTEQEIKELDKVKGLISRESAESVLKKLPYIGFDDDMTLQHYNLNERDGKYYMSLGYGNKDGEEYRNISADFNAADGKLLSYYNGEYYEREKTVELNETQKQDAYSKIEKFLKAAAKEEYGQISLQTENGYDYNVNRDYDRTVNGIRYINDGIYVEFDTKLNKVTSYRLDFDTERTFADPSAVIGDEKAYESLLEISPLKKRYIISGGVYKACFTLESNGTQIDAFTGKEYNEPDYTEEPSFEYTDISGHWAESYIKKLAEVQIGFDGDKFSPDAPVSQFDLLRLFGAGIRYKSYLGYSEDDLYRELITEKILAEEEKNPQGQVAREDAFVYMVRFDGLEKVAKLSNIFKVEYADGNLLSDGKIGYPAILTGLGIICGDGGYLRPLEPITRAEAIVMIYNYMMKSE